MVTGIPFADEVLVQMFDAVWDYTGAPLGRQLGYLIFFGSKTKELKDVVKILESKRDTLQHEVDEAKANAKGIEKDAEDWISDVNKILDDAEKFPEDKDHAKTGYLNYLWWRHQLGRQAFKILQEADQKMNSMPERVHYWLPLTDAATDAAVFSTGYERFESRMVTVSKIMEALRDSNVKRIGVSGPGGVGKTTLIQEVAMIAQDDKLFDLVVTAKVTANPDKKKIQAHIADMLSLKFEEESEMGRATRLRQRLNMEKRNVLLILDDLWEGIDLHSLGIPSRDDQRKGANSGQDRKRISILLTSRSKEVLSNQMGVKETCIFSVGVLSEREGETLLMKMAGIDDSSELASKAAEIASKCGGLPVAIVALAKALKKKRVTDWDDALRLLDMDEAVDFSIKLSYDHLEEEELKSMFLLCAQMGQDPLIKELVKYCMGLGLFYNVYSVKEAEDRTNRLIAKLKDSCLLVDSYSSDRFTMNGVVRDVALSIASKDQHMFSLRNGKLFGWPSKYQLKICTAVFLQDTDIGDELPEGLDCPRLQVFHLDSKDPFLRIPDNFLEGMKELKVLVLTGMDLSSLPSSIKFLKNLQMLCLEQCVLGDVSVIGELKDLRILSFSESKIEELSREIGKLSQLQLLDLSNCSRLKVIPQKVISSLKHLQELYMGNSFFQWEAEGTTNGNRNSSLDELRHLPHLRSLDIQIPDVCLFPKNLYFDKLEKYNIFVGNSWSWSGEYQTSRILKLQVDRSTGFRFENGIKILFKRVEHLSLAKLSGVKSVIHHLNWKEFPDLTHLDIQNNDEIQYIVSSKEWLHPHNSFPSLESLVLNNLRSLENVCHGQLTLSSFRKLRSIKINKCHKLKNLFPFSKVGYHFELQKIKVSHCWGIQEIFSLEGEHNVDRIEFTQLLSLKLKDLEKLVAFVSAEKTSSISQSTKNKLTDRELGDVISEEEHGSSFSLFWKKVAFPNLESLELSGMKSQAIWNLDQPYPSSFPNLTTLKVEGCTRLRYLFSLSMATSLVNLSSLTIGRCRMMEEILMPEENVDEKVPIFPNLKTISIVSMKKLTKIWPQRINPDSFCSLKMLTIRVCHSLVTIFPSETVGTFQRLEKLRVIYCDSVEQVFDLKCIDMKQKQAMAADTQLQDILLFCLPKLVHVWITDPQGIMNFKNLQHVRVTGCDSLRNLFPLSVATGIENIESLTLGYNSIMEEIVAREEGPETSSSITFVLPQLTCLKLVDLRELQCFYSGRHTLEFPVLEALIVLSCNKLEVFTADATDPEVKKQIFSVEKVIPGLKELILSYKDSKWMFNRYFPVDLFRNLKELELNDFEGDEIPYWFLHRVPNLENLILRGASFEKVFPCESIAAHDDTHIGTVVQLKELYLQHMPKLKSICEEGYELDPILQRLENLNILRCPIFINLVPSSVSFHYLTCLEVSFSDGLVSLVASSTAKSLAQLMTMKISNCQAIKEIIFEEKGYEMEDEIVFSQLKTLELENLPELTSFCSGSSAFKFPLLEKVLVRHCGQMKMFCHGVLSTPKLHKVHKEEEEEEVEEVKTVGYWYWEGELNATINKLFKDMVAALACNSRQLNLADHPQLKEIWTGEVPVQDKYFGRLENLTVDKCDFLSNLNVISSKLLPLLKNLKKMEVHNCDSVEVIFDLEGIYDTEMTIMETAFPLRNLILDQLENLKHVWNKDPAGIPSFRNLQKVKVSGCNSLKNLFPVSVATDLVQLEELDIENCGIEEIVAKDEASEGATIKFVLPRASKFRLWNLPELKNFYSGKHTLECPMLKEMIVYNCEKLELPTSESQIYKGPPGQSN
ncbi:Disease resistance protein [Quillaja saponaria]|uniref:Disease resistance protein n=1 Tax=Quillaja saponaria TaxID=32244 RepID=A0AAD7QEF8_QUISA|nr:Disease resistance protein [Quillaja saponaria]